MSSITEAALEWAADGIPVFPCNLKKRPMTQNGFYDASTDPVQVQQMFDLAGECLIGARMGAASGLFACDFDVYKPGAAGRSAQQFMAELLAKGILPDTQQHRTMQGGLHLIYEADEQPNCAPVDGVEIKGEGGYIILPPSRGYSIEQDVGFTRAPKALIETLLKARRNHTDKTVAQHEQAIISGASFHDAATSIAAKMFRRGASAAEVYERISNALDGSVAKSPQHPRHDRWKTLREDSSGELSRILNSGREKFDPNAKTDNARDNFTDEDIERMRQRAEMAGFSPSRGEYYEEPESTPTADDYAGQWPFEGEGYFAGEDLEISDQRFNLYPLYAENESVVIAADPKAGKTAISLKLAVQLAAGRSLGPFKVTDSRAVLYYALEGTRAIKLRLEAEKRLQKEQGNALPDNLPLFVVERPTNFISKIDENVAKVVASDIYLRETNGVGLGLVVIDTLTKAMPGSDQNSVDDTSALFDFTSRLRAEGVSATVVYVHHTGKDGRTRGSSNIEAEVDVVLKMRKQSDGSTMMYVHMARSIDDNSQYRFELNSYDLGDTAQGIRQSAPVVTLSEGNLADDHTGEDAKRAQIVAQVLNVVIQLGNGEHNMKDVGAALKDAKVVAGRTIRKAVVELLDIVFDRENEVVFKGHVIAAIKDNGGYVGVSVKEPGYV